MRAELRLFGWANLASNSVIHLLSAFKAPASLSFTLSFSISSISATHNSFSSSLLRLLSCSWSLRIRLLDSIQYCYNQLLSDRPRDHSAARARGILVHALLSFATILR